MLLWSLQCHLQDESTTREEIELLEVKIRRAKVNLHFLHLVASGFSGSEEPCKLDPLDSGLRPISVSDAHAQTTSYDVTDAAAGRVPDSAAAVNAAAAAPEATAHDQQFVAAAQEAAAACEKDALVAAVMQRPELASLIITHDSSDSAQLEDACTQTGVDARGLFKHKRGQQFATVTTLC